MFKLIKSFCGEWIVVPFDSPGYSILAIVLLGLVGMRFIVLAGLAFLLPAALMFIVLPLLLGACRKLNISRGWLCIIHGILAFRIIDVIDAAKGSAGADAWMLLAGLVFVLIGAVAVLLFTADENFAMFFIVMITSILYFLNFLSEISFTTGFITVSIITQIIVTLIDQTKLINSAKKTKEKRK